MSDPLPRTKSEDPAVTGRDASSEAIEALVRRWGEVIRRAASRFGLTDAEHDEVVQDVRIRIWRALERQGGRTEALLPGYAYQAATSAAIDLVRRRRGGRKVTLVPIDSIAESRVHLSSSSQGGDEEALAARMEQALTTLSMERRVAVQLHLRGRSLGEIGRMTGWTAAKARNLLYRGLTDLKANLQSAEGAAG